PIFGEPAGCANCLRHKRLMLGDGHCPAGLRPAQTRVLPARRGELPWPLRSRSLAAGARCR
ncbi:MAG TPA: hypothetical protein VN153_09390, partial [Tahibacter sp.]|nr:hypothetical protein [Tahibacter sp.]